MTDGTTHEVTQAESLIDGIDAKYLLADRGYDSERVLSQANERGMSAVIPPRRHRRIQRSYDKELYRLRGLVENASLYLKRWRGIATRYAKNSASFLAAVQIRCTASWANIL